MLGASGAYLLFRAPMSYQEHVAPVAPQHLSCQEDLSRERARANELERKLLVSGESKAPESWSASQGETEAGSAASEQHEAGGADVTPAAGGDRVLAWRVSAIEKFIPLSDEQRERLRAKFQEEQLARQQGRESTAEDLEAIVGQEQAATYRQQVQAAFERVQNQEIEKEALWLSRKLSLSPQQEQQMRSVFVSVESQVDKEFSTEQHGVARSAQDRVAQMVAENKRRVQLRAEAIKPLLDSQQFADYMREESQSAAADMEVFHDSPE